MPMFDFVCGKCGEEFEELVSAGDDTSPACPACGSTKTKRQMSVPAKPKSHAFPFKPGPVMPWAKGGPAGGCAGGSCGMGGGCGSAPDGGCGAGGCGSGGCGCG